MSTVELIIIKDPRVKFNGQSTSREKTEKVEPEE